MSLVIPCGPLKPSVKVASRIPFESNTSTVLLVKSDRAMVSEVFAMVRVDERLYRNSRAAAASNAGTRNAERFTQTRHRARSALLGHGARCGRRNAGAATCATRDQHERYRTRNEIAGLR